MRPRVGCGHAGTGAVAVSSMPSETAVLYRCVCFYESYEYQNDIIYRLLEHVFERRYRATTTRTGLQASPTVLLHHLTRCNNLTGGRLNPYIPNPYIPTHREPV